jgi:hypothetical protein
VTAEGAAARDRSSSRDARPYAPSWIDWLIRAIDRLPGPIWLAYVVLTAIAFAFLSFVAWLAGGPTGGAAQAVLAFMEVYPLALYHYLSNGAGEAWDRFRPATDLDEAASSIVRYRLTVTPARAAAALLIGGSAAYLVWAALDTESLGMFVPGRSILYVVLRVVSESIDVGLILGVIYFIVRQLRLVSSLDSSATKVNLYQPGPLHALSRLTARAAIGLVVLGIAIAIPLPGTSERYWLGIVLLVSLPLLAVALAVFAIPLRGISGRLVAERERLLSNVNERLQATGAALHQFVDQEAGKSGDAESWRLAQTRADALNKAYSSLLQERDFVRHLPTWPWDGTAFRAVASAIALPILLFVITTLIERLIK